MKMTMSWCCAIAGTITMLLSHPYSTDAQQKQAKKIADQAAENLAEPPADDEPVDDLDPEQAKLEENIRKSIEIQSKAFKTNLEQKMAMRVDELIRVCKLDEKQTKKIRLAAKGAVSRASQKWDETMRKSLERGRGKRFIPLPPVAAAPVIRERIVGVAKPKAVNKPKPAVTKKAAKAAKPLKAAPKAKASKVAPKKEAKAKKQGVARRVTLVAPAVPAAPVDVAAPVEIRLFAAGGRQAFVPMIGTSAAGNQAAQESIWTKTVDAVLTTEQKQAFETHLKRRAKFVREGRVRDYIATLDASLFLTDDQRKELTKIVDATIGDQLVKMGGRQVNAWRPVNGQLLPFGNLQVPEDKIKTTLSKQQFETWKSMNPGARRHRLIEVR